MYKKIVFPIDLDQESSVVNSLQEVLALVKAFSAELFIITVIPDYGMSMVEQYFPVGWIEETINKAKEDINKIIAKNVPSDIKVTPIVSRGAIYQCVIDEANNVKADLIVMAAHRPELSDYLLGPNAAKIVRHASQSVLVVRTKKP